MIRFQADADLNQSILLARLPALDFQSATDAGLAGLTDPQVLALSAGQDRILVTHDMRTMPHHFASLIQEHRSPGVIIVPQSMRPAQVTLVLAVALYKDGALSLGRAARVASVTVSDMATHLSHLGIPVAGEDPREASAQDSGLGISAGAF